MYVKSLSKSSGKQSNACDVFLISIHLSSSFTISVSVIDFASKEAYLLRRPSILYLLTILLQVLTASNMSGGIGIQL